MDEKIFEKFSESARTILVSSQQIAQSMNSQIGSEHILLALVINRGTFANEVLREYDVNLDQVKLILSLHESTKGVGDKNGITEEAKNLLVSSTKSAADYGHVTVDAEHLLLVISSNEQLRAHDVIIKLGINPEHIKRQIENLFDEMAEVERLMRREEKTEKKPSKTKPKTKTPALDYFTLDLTQRALLQELDPVIGRKREVARAIQILSRRGKNNPVLVGEPGVGKTAIVEGLAQAIVAGNVPPNLLNKRIIMLDLTLLIAGTMYRGQFEDRIKKILDEIKAANDIILFIDEIHTVVGAGSAEGSLDAANILKPALTKGWIRLIGATTSEEYRKHIKKDTAFERRLQAITIEEPTSEEAISILKGLRPHYEKHHEVVITDMAIEAAVALSARYIVDRFLPDKAIDLIDEAGASARLSRRSPSKANDVLRQLARAEREKEQAVSEENYTLATALKSKIEDLKVKLSKFDQIEVEKPTIDEYEIAQLVSESAKVPMENLLRSEKVKYTNIEQALSKIIVGQAEAVRKIASALKRTKAGIADANRPIGSFLFLGPTGVGKTELAKTLAREIFGSDKALIRLDMSEFMERHNASRLLGAPAGYVGYEDGGKLAQAVRLRPYSVVLFDELEKAHPDIFNLLLQIMDDGQLSDAKGQLINFRNTIIILTSNLGLSELTKQAALGFKARNLSQEAEAIKRYNEIKSSLEKTLKDHFKPEFLNRLDEIITFQPLTKLDLLEITKREIDKLALRLERLGFKLRVQSRVYEQLVNIAYHPDYGARPIKRVIAERIEGPISELLLSPRRKSKTIKVGYKTGRFYIEALQGGVKPQRTLKTHD